MVKLVATDMDGTFLKENGCYDKKRLAKLLPMLKEKGIIFTVSSGRSILAIDKLFAEVLDQIAVVGENGSVVQYQNKIIFSDAMTKMQYTEVAEKIAINPYYSQAGLLFSGQKASYILKGSPQAYCDRMKLFYENVTIIDNIDDMDHDTIYKITTSFDPDKVLIASDWLKAELPFISAVATGFESIDVILKEVNKGFGLEHLCRSLGFTAKDVIAFGDNINDLEMLTFAGKAIATENARSEVKALSDQIIGHCDQEAVMDYLERLVDHE